MAALLFVAFIVVPVVEIYLITQVASQLDWPITLALVIGVSVLGAWLVKREGVGVISRVRDGLATGRLPTDELADGAMIFFASALMLTPGFLTDFVGLALLIPPIRSLLRPPVISFFKKRIHVKAQTMGVSVGRTRAGSFGGFGPGGGNGRPGFGRDVYDVDASRESAEAHVTDITPEPGELTDPNE